MVKTILIAAACFTIGNIVWDKFGMDDPRLFYVPLSVLLFLLLWYVRKKEFKSSKVTQLCIDYFCVLALGNIVKQVCYYNDTVKQINDYIWGGLITLIYAIQILWVIRKRKNGGKV